MMIKIQAGKLCMDALVEPTNKLQREIKRRVNCRFKENLICCPCYSCGTSEKPQELEQQKCLKMGGQQRIGRLG